MLLRFRDSRLYAPTKFIFNPALFCPDKSTIFKLGQVFILTVTNGLTELSIEVYGIDKLIQYQGEALASKHPASLRHYEGTQHVEGIWLVF